MAALLSYHRWEMLELVLVSGDPYQLCLGGTEDLTPDLAIHVQVEPEIRCTSIFIQHFPASWGEENRRLVGELLGEELRRVIDVLAATPPALETRQQSITTPEIPSRPELDRFVRSTKSWEIHERIRSEGAL